MGLADERIRGVPARGALCLGGAGRGQELAHLTVFDADEKPEPVIYDAIYDGRVVRSEWDEAAGALIADARSRAGMTQAELAARAHTVQSAVAAYEAGRRQPTLPTLYRILAAAGFDLRARLASMDDHDQTLAAWEASLPAAERDRWRAKLAAQRRSATVWVSS